MRRRLSPLPLSHSFDYTLQLVHSSIADHSGLENELCLSGLPSYLATKVKLVGQIDSLGFVSDSADSEGMSKSGPFVTRGRASCLEGSSLVVVVCNGV